MNAEITIRGNTTPSRRVLAWWDVDVDIGTFSKRKLTARPLKELERALGHRLHVESRWRHHQLPPSVWKFEAYNYLDTADPELAAYSVLMQVGELTGSLGTSWQGYRTAATASTDNPDDSTICAFYWNPPDQHGMQRILSSGVMLKLVDPSIGYGFDHGVDALRLAARPVVKVPSAPSELADYFIDFTAHITCGNKLDLMNLHLPRFQATNWPLGLELAEVDALTHAGKPNIIRIRERLREVREHEAVARCLSFARSFRIKLGRNAGFRLEGERLPSRSNGDGVASFVMTRV